MIAKVKSRMIRYAAYQYGRTWWWHIKCICTPLYMLPPDGYIYMYMPQAFKNILHFLLCHIFVAKRRVAMTYGVTHLKRWGIFWPECN